MECVCVSQSAVNVTRDFEGCSTLRKYFGQLHYLQSRVPMGTGQEAAVPISWYTHTHTFSDLNTKHLSAAAAAVICSHLGASAGCRTEIFSGKTVTHDDISYEQACILYNLGQSACCSLAPRFPASRLGFADARFKAAASRMREGVHVAVHEQLRSEMENFQIVFQLLVFSQSLILQVSADKMNSVCRSSALNVGGHGQPGV